MILMVQLLHLHLLLPFFILFISGIKDHNIKILATQMEVSATNLTVTNNCNHTIWPGVSTIHSDFETTRFVDKIPMPTVPNITTLQKGESKSIEIRSSWNGYIWGRTYCSKNSTGYFSCITGDCGTGKYECYISPSSSTTIASFMGGSADVFEQYYSVMVDNGYNLPMEIVPLGRSRSNCTPTGCTINLNDTCPEELKVTRAGGDVVACQALNKDTFCKSATLYSRVFKKACPDAITYQEDNISYNNLTCAKGPGYAIIFCPSTNRPPPAALSPAPSATPTSIPIPAPTAIHPTLPPSGNGVLPTKVIISVVLIIFAIIFLIITFCYLRRKANNKHNLNMEATGLVNENEISEVEALQYDLSILKAATNNFSPGNKIGEGGFGEVFKGTINNGKKIAVKRLSKSSGHDGQEFKNEVLLVAKLQHRNLVRLLGYCLDKEEKLLIFEYVPNGSLDFILFDSVKQQSLDWSRRYKIIGGVILYLHEDSRLRIIHGDIKASNVLLDKDMNAKLSDFGLARMVGLDETQGSTNRVVGTFGYMSPEYIMHGQFSVKSDVFSFGVLMLEILSGKRNNRFYQSSEHLLSHAWNLWNDGKYFDMVDPALGDSFNKNQVTRCIHIGLLCVQEDINERPTMALVVTMLNSNSMTLPITSSTSILSPWRNYAYVKSSATCSCSVGFKWIINFGVMS